METIKAKIYKLSKSQKWVLNYVEPKTGKRIRKRFERKRNAVLHLSELQNGKIQEKEVILDKTTLKEIIENYLKLYPTSSFTKVKKFYNLFFQRFKDTHPKSITPEVLRDWLIKVKIENNYSLKSIKCLMDQIQVIFRYMVQVGYIAESPVKKITIRNRADFFHRNKLSQDNIKVIFEHLFYYSPYFLYRLFYLMYYAVLTKREIAHLKWEHINFKENRINIINPKSGFVRSFQISDELIKFIDSFPQRSEYLLTNRLGRKIDTNLIARQLINFRERYPNAPHFTCDDIRNAAGIHFIERGEKMENLKMILGHSDIEITKRLFSAPKKKFLTQTSANLEEIQLANFGIEVQI